MEIAEVNWEDLSLAGDPILRALAEEDRGGWRRSADQARFENEARDFLEDPSGGNAQVIGQPTTWEHRSGEIAVQYTVTLGGDAVIATVLFAPRQA